MKGQNTTNELIEIVDENLQAPTECQQKVTTFLGVELISVTNLLSLAPRQYFVKDLLLFGQVSMLAGPPNVGKTSIIASIAGHASLGDSFAGRKVAKAATLYVAAEDPYGVAERGAAVLGTAKDDALPFEIYPQPVDLTDTQAMECFGRALGEYIASKGPERLFLVFDTLNLCLGDGDENSSRDMGRAISNAQRLARHHNVHVMIVHHANHSDPQKPRGSSAMIGNIDTLLTLNTAQTQNGEKVIVLQQQKQRSMARGEPLLFDLTAIQIDVDADGDPITLPLAVPRSGDLGQVVTSTPKAGKTGDERSNHLYAVLGQLDANDPGKWHAWASIRDKVAGPFEELKSKPDALRKALARARETLEADKRIEVAEDGSVRIRP